MRRGGTATGRFPFGRPRRTVLVFVAGLFIASLVPVASSVTQERSAIDLDVAETGRVETLGWDPAMELGRPLVDHFGSETGGHDQVWKGWQLEDGALLFATGNGLILHDGAHWYPVRDPALHRVYDLAFADDGRIYLGSSGEFGYLEPQANGTYDYRSLLPSSGNETAQLPTFGDIRQVLATPNGILFAAYGTLFSWRPATGLSWVEIEGTRRLQAVGDEVWLSTEDEVLSLDPATLQTKPALGTEILKGQSISSFIRRPSGAWQALGDGGFFVQATEGFEPWPTAIDSLVADTRLTSQLFLGDGTLVVGTRNQGAYLLDPAGNLIRHLGEAQGLTELWVTSALEDRDGTLWLTHGSRGVSKIERTSGVTVFERDLGVRYAQQIARHRGHLFVATYFGLDVLVPATDLSEQAHFVTLDEGPKVAWSLLDVGDALLVGGVDGVFELRIVDATVQPPRVRVTRISEEHSWVSNLSQDPGRPGTVYATLGSGLLRLDREEGGWVSRGLHSEISAHTYFAEADGGDLWVGTVNEGYLLLTDLERWPDAPWRAFGPDEGVPMGNSHIYRWNDGLLWGTYDGAYTYDPLRQPPFAPDQRFEERLVNGQNDIHRFVDPGVGDPWLIGGSVIAPLVTLPDGKLGQDPTRVRNPQGWRRYALHIDADGTVWIGSREGVIRHDPATARPSREELSPVRLGQVTLLSGGTTLWGGLVPWPADRTLAPDGVGEGLRVEFGLPDSVAGEHIEYRSRLVGLEDEWSPWSRETYRDFTNLPGGELRFEVEAQDRLQRFSRLPPLKLDAPLAWYATWPARVLLAGALLLLGWAIARWRSAKIAERNVELERAVVERTREVSEQAMALAAANERLHEMTLVDLLTGLGNRRMAADLIEREVDWLRSEGRLEPGADRSQDLSLLLVDVDHFKGINDTYGHEVGDRVLAGLGETLRQQSRELDGLVRWGGEEFLIICRRMPRDQVTRVADRLCRSIEEAVLAEVDGEAIRATVSVGFASFPLEPTAPAAVPWSRVLGIADLALYAAKRSGRNGWVGLVVDGRDLAAGDAPGPDRSGGTLTAQVRGWLATGRARVESSFPSVSEEVW